MNDLRKEIEKSSLDALAIARDVIIFMAFSGLAWNFFNEWVIASPEGFDPLRFEYYARSGIPEGFVDSSSYRIVSLLEKIYEYAPYYWGYIIFITSVLFFIRNFDSNKQFSLAIFTPISFYYLGQTGKDGIAIISLVAIAIASLERVDLRRVLFFSFIIGLALYIRPALILIMPIVAIQMRYGTARALLSCFPVSVAFFLVADIFDTVNSLGDLAGDEGAGGLATFLRLYTFGYELSAVATKIVLLILSPIFQPFIGFVKYYNGSPLFVIFESICFSGFLVLIIKDRIFFKFIVSSIPYSLIIGLSSPFYHFRYMVIVYPVIWLYARSSTQWGWRRESALPKRVRVNAENVARRNLC